MTMAKTATKRTAVKASKQDKVRFNMIVTEWELAMYKTAADRDMLTMSAWARAALRKLATGK